MLCPLLLRSWQLPDTTWQCRVDFHHHTKPQTLTNVFQWLHGDIKKYSRGPIPEHPIYQEKPPTSSPLSYTGMIHWGLHRTTAEQCLLSEPCSWSSRITRVGALLPTLNSHLLSAKVKADFLGHFPIKSISLQPILSCLHSYLIFYYNINYLLNLFFVAFDKHIHLYRGSKKHRDCSFLQCYRFLFILFLF